ncbi:hypothetical protein HW561_10750 [Rhodobacteraceae bacterium B1Z28]|uniref:Uncharacterized protein n=1 Tax=Ruegeria haliotis TaxID=2747601 RepID=A0ABX2PSV5_9RHOB|nr:hypothetical protein [Ruegeria haliotis]NVO56267.1 hypothetical protein [Ruegeria haliotis]
MTQPTLTPIRFENGIWQGHVQAEAEPKLEARYLGETLDGIELSPAEDGWDLRVPIPVTALSEGVHCFVIVDVTTTRKLADFTVIAGAPAADDLRVEVELLRAELDMLKRAFRRICHDGE